MKMVYVLKNGGAFEQVNGKRMIDKLDSSGEVVERASLATLTGPAFSDGERAAFGVYLVDTTPPSGKRWTGAFATVNGLPVSVFEDIPPPSAADVNSERDCRLNGTFTFSGTVFDCDEKSLARITGAATLAGFAIGAGAPAGYLKWHGGADDFAWIATDNSLVPMDAQTCFAFGQAAATNQSAHIFAAKALKMMDPIPVDYKDGSYWP